MPVDETYTVPEFRFANGETLRDLRLHYSTFGTPHRNAAGHVDNAVLVLHGTGGDTNQFLRDSYAGVLFVPGGALDARRYFIIITDARSRVSRMWVSRSVPRRSRCSTSKRR